MDGGTERWLSIAPHRARENPDECLIGEHLETILQLKLRRQIF